MWKRTANGIVSLYFLLHIVFITPYHLHHVSDTQGFEQTTLHATDHESYHAHDTTRCQICMSGGSVYAVPSETVFLPQDNSRTASVSLTRTWYITSTPVTKCPRAPPSPA